MDTAKPAIADREKLSGAYPPGIRWDIEIPHIDLVHVIDEAIVKFGDRPAMDFFDKKITYQEMGSLISRAAKGLQDMGIGKGTKVGMFMPNMPFYPVMFFAALRVGATVVNFNSLFTKEELRKQVADSGTTVMVTADLKEFHDKTVALQKEGLLKQVVRCDMADVMPAHIAALFLAKNAKDKLTTDTFNGRSKRSYLFDQLSKKRPPVGRGEKSWDPLKGKRAEKPVINFTDVILNDGYYNTTALDPEDVAVLQYTGGTSGIPKGAMLTHFNLVANSYQIEEFYCDGPHKPQGERLLRPGSERIIAALPWFHVFGMTVAMISAFRMGAEIKIMPNPRDIPALMKAIAKSEITTFPAVPKQLQSITEHKKAHLYDFSKLDMVISGGAALGGKVQRAFSCLAGTDQVVKQGYGQSEASPVISANPPYGLNKSESLGLFYPRTIGKIVDPENPDRVMNIGEVGEVCIQGPQVMKGYHNRPEETAKALRDGWLHTGDLALIDGDCYLHFADRLGRMFDVNGNNVYPNLTEDVLNLHPAVAECAMISLPDPRSNFAGKMFVRLKPDQAGTLTAEDVKAYLKEKINQYQIPKHIEFVTQELPKSLKGQPDWKLLQDKERSKLARETTNHSDPKPG